jgi:hypothetical protein
MGTITVRVLDEIATVINAQTAWLHPDAIAEISGIAPTRTRHHLTELHKTGRIARHESQGQGWRGFHYGRVGTPPMDGPIRVERASVDKRRKEVVVIKEPGVWKYIRASIVAMEDGDALGEVELIVLETQMANAATCDRDKDQSAMLEKCRKLSDKQRRAMVKAQQAGQDNPARSSVSARPPQGRAGAPA